MKKIMLIVELLAVSLMAQVEVNEVSPINGSVVKPPIIYTHDTIYYQYGWDVLNQVHIDHVPDTVSIFWDTITFVWNRRCLACTSSNGFYFFHLVKSYPGNTSISYGDSLRGWLDTSLMLKYFPIRIPSSSSPTPSAHPQLDTGFVQYEWWVTVSQTDFYTKHSYFWIHWPSLSSVINPKATNIKSISNKLDSYYDIMGRKIKKNLLLDKIGIIKVLPR